MPSLFRFFLIIGLLGGLIFATIFGLANYMRPMTRPMATDVPLKNLPAPQHPPAKP